MKAIRLLHAGSFGIPIDYRGTLVGVELLLDPHDFWVGLYSAPGGKSGWHWDFSGKFMLHGFSWDIYICLLPMLPLHIRVLRQIAEGPYDD